ncbi:MAG: hypothetical protein NZ869_04445, partial [Thermoanaerobaculum sp.]|nr:hypothetical protein [Thermoanaerobaculum sp.]MDW7966819.1 hypothetical protein [Thermoanaerobaculum sp.]
MHVLPVVVLFVSGRRHLAGVLGIALLAWLHGFWWLPLLHVPEVPILVAPESPWIQVPGHLLAVLLILAAFGLFSPRPGSPKDLALRAIRRGDFQAAGEFFLQAGKPRRALRLFIKARAWQRAGDVARNLGHLAKAATYYERQGGASLAAAAQLFHRLGNEAKAQTLWLRLGQEVVQKGQPEEAIEPFLRAGDLKRALAACQIALEHRRLRPEMAEVALETCRKAQQLHLAAQVAGYFGRHLEAGELLLAAGQPGEAAVAFERAGDVARAAQAWRLAGETEKAAKLKARALTAGGLLDQAVDELTSAGLHQEAAQVLLNLGKFREAFDRLLLAGLKREAAELATRHLDPSEGARLFEELEEWEAAGSAWERAGELKSAARCFERAGELQRAVEVYGQVGLVGEQARILALLGHIEEAFLVLHRAGDLQGAWELLSRYGGVYPSLAEPLLDVAAFLQAKGAKEEAVSALQRATAGLPANPDLLPVLYKQGELLEELGDLRGAEEAWRKVVNVHYGFRDAAARLQKVRQARLERETARAASAGPPTPAPQDPTLRYVLEQEMG